MWGQILLCLQAAQSATWAKPACQIPLPPGLKPGIIFPMAKKKFNQTELVRLLAELPEYPAVLMPVAEGGYEVIFPNLPGSRSYGIKRETALKAGQELLTAEVFMCLAGGEEPPKASDPKRLIADEDEPPGTELVMMPVELAILKRRLGLEKPGQAGVLHSFGIFGKK